MYIDPRYYASVGYRFQPAYAIPKVATPHLVLVDDHTTPLCGAGKPGERSGHRRFEDKDTTNGLPNREVIWEKPVCANCIKVAAQQGLVEQPPLKLRPNDCPVLSERTGKRHKHIMHTVRPRCKQCKPEDQYKGYQPRCAARKHPNWLRCGSCGAEDRDTHRCDFPVFGQWHYSACDVTAKVEAEYDYHGKKHTGWLCGTHTPQAVAARKAKVAARDAERKAESDARHKKWEEEEDATDILGEMARWIAANRDLAEEDEWLRKIAERMAGNSVVMDALNRKGDDE